MSIFIHSYYIRWKATVHSDSELLSNYVVIGLNQRAGLALRCKEQRKAGTKKSTTIFSYFLDHVSSCVE